jgi:mRNA interferase RelE/StbE/toxin YoeB
MSYALFIAHELNTKFTKLSKKDRKIMQTINKKVNEILKNPHHFKPLRGDMAGVRRVHIEKSFVLLFDVDEINKRVRLLDFDHHDKIY